MEDCVKDAVLTNVFTDLVLLRLAELTIAAETSGRSLFPDLRTEPSFFRRYFRIWVREAMEERRMMEQKRDPAYEEE